MFKIGDLVRSKEDPIAREVFAIQEDGYRVVGDFIPFEDENKWYHFAAAYDGELLHFYCNGELFGSAAFPTPVLNTGMEYVNIGAGYSGNRYQFKGQIAACRLYSRVLAPAEVKMLSKEFNI